MATPQQGHWNDEHQPLLPFTAHPGVENHVQQQQQQQQHHGVLATSGQEVLATVQQQHQEILAKSFEKNNSALMPPTPSRVAKERGTIILPTFQYGVEEGGIVLYNILCDFT